MYCSNCGAESSKKLCTSCGVKQDKNHNFCKWCGGQLSENASVCILCNKKVKENKLVKFLMTAIEVISSLLFLIVFVASFSYFSKGAITGGILLLLFGIFGLLTAFPLLRKTYEKKLKTKIIKPLRMALIIVFLVIIYSFVYPFANNQVVDIEKKEQYNNAVAIMESDPLAAKDKFLELAGFEDSSEKAEETNDHIYTKLGEKLKNDFAAEEEISMAEEYVDALPDDYDDSRDILKEFKYKKGKWMIENRFYAMAKYLFKDIPNYKDVNELLNNPIYGLMGNTYTYSSSVTYNFETYIQTQSLGFSDSINHTFYARYNLRNTTTSDMLQGDLGNSGEAIEYSCYEENGKIILKNEELTPLTTEKGKITSFLYKDNIYEIGNTN